MGYYFAPSGKPYPDNWIKTDVVYENEGSLYSRYCAHDSGYIFVIYFKIHLKFSIGIQIFNHYLTYCLINNRFRILHYLSLSLSLFSLSPSLKYFSRFHLENMPDAGNILQTRMCMVVNYSL